MIKDIECLDNLSFSKYDNDQIYKIVKDHSLCYRMNLGLKSNITFGVEIEFEKTRLELIKDIINNYSLNWLVKKELSTQSVDNNFYILGGEVISPILKDDAKTWLELKDICELLEKNHALCLEKCGGHINVGSQILDENTNTWLNMLKIWAIYENIIYRFSYGTSNTPRNNINKYAMPISTTINNILKYYKDANPNDYSYLDIIEPLCKRKCYGLELYDVKNTKFEKDNTIEIRCPNGTISPVIWQNNINFFTKLLKICKTVDTDFLNYKIKNIELLDLKDYQKLDLKIATELSDLIFDNNLDKLNFLKQYLKKDRILNENKLKFFRRILVKKK